MGGLAPSLNPLSSAFPAIEAWRRLGVGPAEISNADVIAESDKTLVCRLSGPGLLGRIVAKRRAKSEIDFETRVYTDVLPRLPLPSLQFYGMVADSDPRLSWLFIEDAGDDQYSFDNAEHRARAAQWLGLVHSCPEVDAIAHLLPQHDSGWYFFKGQDACQRIREGWENPALTEADRESLTVILRQMDTILEHGEEVQAACARIPRTLVHGDFFPKNIRLRTSPAGLNLYPLDWETASYTVPSTDVAYHIDLDAYLAAVRPHWPHLSLEDLKQIARYGRIFRMMVAIEWSSYGLDAAWPERPMRQMATYRLWLAELIQEMGW